MLIGLVGKPSVGKSSVFQALTSVPVARASYPFTTIEPNRGVGFVEVECVDKDFGVQCNPRSGFCVNGRRFVPVQILDVAGLVPGAHEGKGLGNKFLDDLRQADVFIHVVDASGGTNEGGENVALNSYDPVKDVTFLEQELDYWIKGILDANWGKIARDISEKPEEKLAKQLSGLGVTIQHVKHAILDKQLTEWSDEELLDFCRKIRKASKPIVIAANKCDMPGAFANYERIKKQFPDYLVVPCSAEAEITLKTAGKAGFVDYLPGDADFKIIKQLSPEQTKGLEFIRSTMKQLNGTGVQKCLNSAVFDYLKYIAVFPGGTNKLSDSKGNIIPDCFLMPPGSTALDFARALHSDFAEKFIKAINAKTKRALGAEYQLQHRDVLEIMFHK